MIVKVVLSVHEIANRALVVEENRDSVLEPIITADEAAFEKGISERTAAEIEDFEEGYTDGGVPFTKADVQGAKKPRLRKNRNGKRDDSLPVGRAAKTLVKTFREAIITENFAQHSKTKKPREMVRFWTLWPDNTRRVIFVEPVLRGYRISREALDAVKKREDRRANPTKSSLYRLNGSEEHVPGATDQSVVSTLRPKQVRHNVSGIRPSLAAGVR